MRDRSKLARCWASKHCFRSSAPCVCRGRAIDPQRATRVLDKWFLSACRARGINSTNQIDNFDERQSFRQIPIPKIVCLIAQPAIVAPQSNLTILVVLGRNSGLTVKSVLPAIYCSTLSQVDKIQMSKDVHDIAATVRLRLERSDSVLFKFLRSCVIEETHDSDHFFCRAIIDGAAVQLMTSNKTMQVIKQRRRAVQHIDIDSHILFETCRRALQVSKQVSQNDHETSFMVHLLCQIFQSDSTQSCARYPCPAIASSSLTERTQRLLCSK